jgi:hypothetical protein
MAPLLDSDQYMHARARFETEHDNFREALSWSLRPDRATPSTADKVELGLLLCTEFYSSWWYCGDLPEARPWLERAIEQAGGNDRPELAGSLSVLRRGRFDAWGGSGRRRHNSMDSSPQP